jgi:hypothetical protein
MPSKKGLPKALDDEGELDERKVKELHGTDSENFLHFAQDFFPGGEEFQEHELYPNLNLLRKMFQSKSACIRYLYSLDPKLERVKQIAKHLNIRYQHARNVITTKPKRGPNEDWTKPRPIFPPTTTTETTDDDHDQD